MATQQEVQAAMSGFPRTLAWANFTPVQTSRNPPHAAQTSATWSMGGWRPVLQNGVYKVSGARVSVTLNPGQSWAIQSARSNADLLIHEQGHYNITGLVARTVIQRVLDLSYDAGLIEVVIAAGNTANSRMQYVQQQFQTNITRFGQEANAAMARLQTNPVTQQDGLYDVQTGHGLTTAGQSAWNARISRAMSGNDDFLLLLAMEGLL